MKKIFFVDESDSSKQNGIGTYRNIIISLMHESREVHVSLISLNAEVPEFRIKERYYGKEYQIPKIGKENWRKQGDLICPLLRCFIQDSECNIFIFNHSPCDEFIDSLKNVFPYSKAVFIVHDQGWCEPLFGNIDLLSGILSGQRPERIPDNVIDFIYSYCEKERILYQKTDSVVVLSESTERIIKDIYGVINNIVVIPNGYKRRHVCKSKMHARQKLGIRSDDELLIFVARPRPYKGVSAVMHAIGELRQTHPNIRCAFIGDARGYAKFWETGKSVASNLILTDSLSQEELSLWYAAADLGVIASYSEQCSFAALEMMNAGLTIVTSDAIGQRDIFRYGENAILVRIEDIFDQENYGRRIAAAIEKALSIDDTKRKEMRFINRKLISAGGKYSAEKMIENYRKLFESL